MDRRVEKTRAAIRSAYFSILMEGGKKRPSITQIARRANIDRKTFYLHYDSVEAIAREFTQEKVEELVGELRDVIIFESSFNMKKLFERLNGFIYKNLDIYRFISINKEYDYFLERMRKMLVEIVVESGGKYFSMPQDELEFYAEFYISGIVSAYTYWMQKGMPIGIDKLADNVSLAATRGIQGVLEGKIKIGDF